MDPHPLHGAVMANEAKLRGWSSVLKSVKTPLGLFTLVALILDGVLVPAASFTGNPPLLWAPLALLALLILVVWRVMVKNPRAFYPPSEWPRPAPVSEPFELVRLRVRGKPRFSEDGNYSATYTITGKGREPRSGEQDLLQDPPYRILELENVYPNDLIRVTIVDDQGLRWEIAAFNLWDHFRDAFRGRGIEKWARPPGAGEISETKPLEPTAPPEGVVRGERVPAFTSETSSTIASNEPRRRRAQPNPPPVVRGR
jgi:hypothetical protein